MTPRNRHSPFDHLLDLLVSLPRLQKQFIVLISDSLLLTVGLWLSFSLRLGAWYVPEGIRQWFLLLVAPIIAVPIFVKLGLYRAIIRYVGDQVLWAILKSMSLTALIWACFAFMLRTPDGQSAPRTVPWIFWLIGCGLISSSRFFARHLFSTTDTKNRLNRFVLIYGAGTAGRQLAASLRKGFELKPVGFVDDDPALVGKEIDGLRVFSNESLPSIIKKVGIKDIIVTLSSASNKRKREVVQLLEKLSVKVRILPSVSSIAQGRHLVNMIREVDIGDLLGRDPVSPDPVLLGRCVQGKNVLVTGAGGSIGSELCRQLLALNPARLLLMDSNEAALFQIHRTLISQTDTEVIQHFCSHFNR
ncbi:polysaccharide biosynthesis protein [bacterium]|nr:polysaccharide biosynthesis protein [bacterium]